MMTLTLDGSSVLGAALLIAGALIVLAREVSSLTAVVRAHGQSLDLERAERKQGDERLEQRITRLEEKE